MNNNTKKVNLFLIMCGSKISWSNYTIEPPLGLIALASYIKNNDDFKDSVEVYICDLNIKEGRNYYEKKLDAIKNDNQAETIFGFSVNMFNIEDSLARAREMKYKFPNAKVIMGGHYVTTYLERYDKYKELLSEYNIDCFIPFRGEKGLTQVVSCMHNNSSFSDLIEEESHKYNDKNNLPIQIEDYQLQYSLLEYLDAYQEPQYVSLQSGQGTNKGLIHLPYISSFGCPHRAGHFNQQDWCRFCSLWDKQYRTRSVKFVTSEVMKVLEKLISKDDLKGRPILLRDVSDYPNPEAAREIKKAYNDQLKNLNSSTDLSILAYFRADKGFIESNIEPFDTLFIGTESGSDEILKGCNKEIAPNDLEEAFKLAKEKGKKLITSFILGLKEESYGTIDETIKFIDKNIDPKLFLSAGVNVFVPFPGSPFFDELIKRIGTTFKVEGIKDLVELQRRWVQEFTHLSYYEINFYKLKVQDKLKEKLLSSSQYFDFGLNKRLAYDEEETQPELRQIFNDYFENLVALSEYKGLSGNYWGTISIREPLLKKVYSIKEALLNKNFFVGDSDENFEKQKENFQHLNQLCFSGENSFLNKNILAAKLPTISDILPQINKSLLITRELKPGWSDIETLFDYHQVVTFDDLSALDIPDNCDGIVNYAESRRYGVIDKMANDYESLVATGPANKKFDRDKIRASFNQIFAMYELHLRLGYDIFIYYPMKISEKGEIAFTLGLKFENFKNFDAFNSFFSRYLKIINFVFSKTLFQGILNENTNNALRAALAAIMSRNMSHNIGSHILANAGTTSQILKQIDMQVLNRYIQLRMDFIAQISTESPQWSYPCWFYKDLMRQFYMQKLLLTYISSSEGLSAYEYDNPVRNKVNKKLEVIFENVKNSAGFDGNAEQKKDSLVAIPGGIIGQQAFYIILEDIIRNSAKHNWACLQDPEKDIKNLKITVRLEDKPENEFVKVCIHDNISRISKDVNEKLPSKEKAGQELPLHQKMNLIFISPLIDIETGRLKKENWGMAEMRICAGYLQKRTIEEIGKGGESTLDNIIKAVTVKDSIDGDYHLGYEFKIYKPKEVLIVGHLPIPDGVDKNELKKFSVYLMDELPEEVDYEFIVFYDDKNNEFIKKLKNKQTNNSNIGKANRANGCNEADIYEDIENLPYRLFVITDDQDVKRSIDNDVFLKKRIVLLSNNDFNKLGSSDCQNDKQKQCESFKINLYNKWCDYLIGWRNSSKSQELKVIMKIYGADASNDRGSDEINSILSSCKDCNEKENIKKGIFKTFGLDQNYEPSTLPLDLRAGWSNQNFNSSYNEPWKEFDQDAYSLGYNLECPAPNDTVDIRQRDAIIYARHREWTKGCNAIYFESLSGVAQHFLLLAKPPNDDYMRKKIFLQAIENGLLRIGIVDERVAQSSILTDYYNYIDAGQIFIFKKFLNYEIPNVRTKRHGEISFENEIKITKSINASRNCEECDLDFLIIHQGILDKVCKNKEKAEELIKKLKTKVPFIVVTSGRGEPSNIPENVKFLPFANIESTIGIKPHSKFILTQILMNLIKRKGKN
jgi:radical SAM superfamily enzyme YgiQ (UPF0313 family)